MKPEDKNISGVSDLEQCVCKTVNELLPMYNLSGDDSPEGVLDSCPDPKQIVEGLTILIDAMVPGRMSTGPIEAEELGIILVRRLSHAWRLLRPEIERAIRYRWIGAAAIQDGAKSALDSHETSFEVMRNFYNRLPSVRKLIIEDIKAAYEGDPAALTFAEVQLAYPGLLAVISHRLTHELYKLDVPIVPRIMSEWTHSKTGVDINPGAQIGHGLFIDHATGVVIGETCRIGNNVKLYQGVTLGAKSFPLDEFGRPIKHIQRHPTVEDDVVIYANATILGGETVIGRGSTIGGNVFLLESVPQNSFVASKHPELHIKTNQDD